MFHQQHLQFNYVPRKLFKSIYKSKDHHLISNEIFNTLSDSYYVSIAQYESMTITKENVLSYIIELKKKVECINEQINQLSVDLYFIGYIINHTLFNEMEMKQILINEKEKKRTNPQTTEKIVQRYVHSLNYKMIDSIIYKQQQISNTIYVNSIPILSKKMYL